MHFIECQTGTEPKALQIDKILLTKPKFAYFVDPLKDSRWDELVKRHPRASLFHSSAWLRALSRTYGYTPAAYTTSAPDEVMENGMVFCRVESWLTGRRLVSLPFSDHCDPLIDAPADLDTITAALEKEIFRDEWRYMEMRPLRRLELVTALPQASIPYTFHLLDLSPDVETLYRNCHKNSTQRKILRAEREGLRYREGRDQELLDYFYTLQANTRKRHSRPPQPKQWFNNLIEGMGDALKIRVAFHGNRPVAAVITICHKDTMVYKYGGSDPDSNKLGGVHMLLWRAIQEAKSSGLRFFDFGRSEVTHEGLITFKKRWGATQSDLIYSRYGLSDEVAHMFESSGTNWKSNVAHYLLSHMQPSLLSMAGRVLYRHVG
jgi:CelD/BcsL family acetyltransferase involved in cellulose biosynthesis